MKKFLSIICAVLILFTFSGCLNVSGGETESTAFETSSVSTSAAETTVSVTETSAELSTHETTTMAATSTEAWAVTTEESKEKTEPSKSDTIYRTSADTSETTQTESEKVKNENICTVEIDCLTILPNKAKLKNSAKEFLPKNGIILENTDIEINDGDSAFDVLLKACADSTCGNKACKSCKNAVEVSYSKMPVFSSVYIDGIHGIFEKDCGASSGWMYSVNGEFPQVSADAYQVQKGDRVSFIFTCDGGKDVGER